MRKHARRLRHQRLLERAVNSPGKNELLQYKLLKVLNNQKFLFYSKLYFYDDKWLFLNSQ